jgi:hypothetical protein
MSESEPDQSRGRQHGEWYVVLGVCMMIAAAAACWKIAKVIFAPSTAEAMTRSLAELRIPELTIAYTLHPDACTITRMMWRWSVECAGVPTHFYQDAALCDPGPPKTCGAMPSDYKSCITYIWDIDLDAKPSDPIGKGGRRYASIGEGCNPKGALSSDREEMVRRGITPRRVEIVDRTGSYPGKPREIRPE